MKRAPNPQTDNALAQCAKALAHPARIALVRALGHRPACCGHLVRNLAAQDLSLAQSTVSQHLRVLVDAGLVNAQPCGVETSFTLNQGALAAALRELGTLIPGDPASNPAANRSADQPNRQPEQA